MVVAIVALLLVTALQGWCSTSDSAAYPNDSVVMTIREPDAQAQDEIYSDDQWKYITEEQKSSSEDSFFDRLLEDLLRSLFRDYDGPDMSSGRPSGSSSVNWWGLFIIIIGAALLVLFIVKATGAGGNRLFKGKSKRKEIIDASAEDVDIHGIDYDAEITGARNRLDYRMAVRLWFLRSLKLMADESLIEWKIDKTNSDYYYELKETKFQKEFGSVSNLYDYVWYGEFKLSELRYREAEDELRKFYERVKQEEDKAK